MRLYSVLITVYFFLSIQNSAKAVTIIVNSETKTIQQSIDMAQAGDTIIISPGTYKEHEIVIKKRLTIIGKNFPVIDGENKYELFLVNADSVSISGLQIQNIGKSSMNDLAGIKILNAHFVKIINNKLFNNTYGIYLQHAGYCLIENNMIHSNSTDELNSGNGIHGWQSNNLLIKGNSISGHRDGIYFEFVTESVIIANSSFKNVRYGLHFMFSHNNTYKNNLFNDNGAGVAVMYSRGVTMIGNTFLHNWGDATYGILLKEISDSKIEKNIFLKNTVGIYMEGTNRIQVNDNIFESNGWAIRIQANCSAINFERNNFTANSFDVATNGTLVMYTFKRNFWDKYDGYDLDKNGIGDVPYYPVSVYSVITEKIPVAMILYRSFLTDVMDKAEKVMPSLIPDKLRDDEPRIKKWKL